MRHLTSLTAALGHSLLTARWQRSLVVVTAALVTLAAQSAQAQIRITAAWDANADGRTAGYMISVGTSRGSAGVTVDVGQATSAVLPLAPGAVYYVSVRGYNAQRQVGPASVEATVDLASSPDAPQALRASVQGTVANLSWVPPASGYANQYYLSVGTAPGAENLLSDYPVGNVTSVSGALPPGTYYARLHAGNMVGIGPTSSEVAFQVGGPTALPSTPGTLSSSWSGGTITLRWGQSSGAAAYVIEVGTASGASNIGVLNVGNVTSISTPVPPGTFYVRVRAVNAAGASPATNQIVVRR